MANIKQLEQKCLNDIELNKGNMKVPEFKTATEKEAYELKNKFTLSMANKNMVKN